MSKILLLGNLTWYATAVYNENPNITEINDLNGLYSAVISLFKKEYEDKIMIALKAKKSDVAFEDKIGEIFDPDLPKKLISYNGKTHEVEFECANYHKYSLAFLVTIFSLRENFFLKQRIRPYPDTSIEMDRIRKTAENNYTVNILCEKSKETNELIVFGKKQSGKYQISLILMEGLSDGPHCQSRLYFRGDYMRDYNMQQLMWHVVKGLDNLHKMNIVYGYLRQHSIKVRKKYDGNMSGESMGYVLFNFAYSIDLNETKTHNLPCTFPEDGFSAPETIDERQILAKLSDV